MHQKTTKSKSVNEGAVGQVRGGGELRFQLQQEAVSHHLGEPFAHVVGRPQPISRLGLLSVLIGLVLFASSSALAPFLATLLSTWQVLLPFGIASFWLVAGLWLLLPSLPMRGGIKPLLCTRGLTWKYRQSCHSFRWEEIESLWCWPRSRTWTRYEVRLYERTSIILDSRVYGAEPLARHIEDVMNRRHLPSLMEAYQNGTTFAFGSLSISQRGIRTVEQPEVLAWHHIASLLLIKGNLTIWSKMHQEHWATIPIATLPNFCILEAMIQRVHALQSLQAREEVLERSACGNSTGKAGDNREPTCA